MFKNDIMIGVLLCCSLLLTLSGFILGHTAPARGEQLTLDMRKPTGSAVKVGNLYVRDVKYLKRADDIDALLHEGFVGVGTHHRIFLTTPCSGDQGQVISRIRNKGEKLRIFFATVYGSRNTEFGKFDRNKDNLSFHLATQLTGHKLVKFEKLSFHMKVAGKKEKSMNATARFIGNVPVVIFCNGKCSEAQIGESD